MNFADFEVVNKANTKVGGNSAPRGQSFDFKFRAFVKTVKKQKQDESLFEISNKKFEEMGLADKGLRQINSPDGVPFLAVVDHEHATLLKQSDRLKEGGVKGKAFKSTLLLDKLAALGLIDANKQGTNQKLTLTKVEGSDNAALGGDVVAIGGVYQIAKDESAGEDTEEEKAADAATEEEVEENGNGDGAAVTPEIAPAPQVQAASQDEDEF